HAGHAGQHVPDSPLLVVAGNHQTDAQLAVHAVLGERKATNEPATLLRAQNQRQDIAHRQRGANHDRAARTIPRSRPTHSERGAYATTNPAVRRSAAGSETSSARVSHRSSAEAHAVGSSVATTSRHRSDLVGASRGTARTSMANAKAP